MLLTALQTWALVVSNPIIIVENDHQLTDHHFTNLVNTNSTTVNDNEWHGVWPAVKETDGWRPKCVSAHRTRVAQPRQCHQWPSMSAQPSRHWHCRLVLTYTVAWGTTCVWPGTREPDNRFSDRGHVGRTHKTCQDIINYNVTRITHIKLTCQQYQQHCYTIQRHQWWTVTENIRLWSSNRTAWYANYRLVISQQCLHWQSVKNIVTSHYTHSAANSTDTLCILTFELTND